MSNDDQKLQGLYPLMDKPKKEPRQDNNTKKLSNADCAVLDDINLNSLLSVYELRFLPKSCK